MRLCKHKYPLGRSFFQRKVLSNGWSHCLQMWYTLVKETNLTYLARTVSTLRFTGPILDEHKMGVRYKTCGSLLDTVSFNQQISPIPAVDKYICFRVFAQHASTCWAACVQTLCMIMVKHKLFLDTIFSLTKLSTLHFGQKWAWHLKQGLDLEPRPSLRSRSNSCRLDLELWPSLRSRSNGRGLDLEPRPSRRSRSNSHRLDLEPQSSHRSRSNGRRLDLEPQLSCRSRSNGYGLDLEPQPSLRSRSNGHGLDLEPWPSLRSRSNGHGLDLELWLSLRSRSNGRRLDLELQLSCRSRSNA